VIELVPRDDAERALWSASLDLAELLAGLPWTLVGAQMVLLHAYEEGEVPGRTTGDLDLLFDVRAYVGATFQATKRLLSAGYTETRPNPDGIAHRFTKGVIVVDVLAPESLGRLTSRATIEGGRTVQVPGGTQALERTETVDVRLGDRVGSLPRPSLLGAILLKARAMGAAPDEAAKHRGDLAFLLGLIADPRALADDLRNTERRWLRSRAELLDRANAAWRSSSRPDDAYLALGIMLREPER
jgi:hypothetical protein